MVLVAKLFHFLRISGKNESVAQRRKLIAHCKTDEVKELYGSAFTRMYQRFLNTASYVGKMSDRELGSDFINKS